VKRIRTIVLIILAAVLGALAGRAFAEMRERREAGLDPAGLDPSRIRLRPQEVVPGVVAGFRMGDAPWSWLHIPGWMAAFAVNFAGVALSRDLQRFRDVLEGAGITMAPPPLDEEDHDGHEAPVWTADVPPASGTSGTPPGFTPFRE
jgi:hypothetical protein